MVVNTNLTKRDNHDLNLVFDRKDYICLKIATGENLRWKEFIVHIPKLKILLSFLAFMVFSTVIFIAGSLIFNSDNFSILGGGISFIMLISLSTAFCLLFFCSIGWVFDDVSLAKEILPEEYEEIEKAIKTDDFFNKAVISYLSKCKVITNYAYKKIMSVKDVCDTINKREKIISVNAK